MKCSNLVRNLPFEENCRAIPAFNHIFLKKKKKEIQQQIENAYFCSLFCYAYPNFDNTLKKVLEKNSTKNGKTTVFVHSWDYSSNYWVQSSFRNFRVVFLYFYTLTNICVFLSDSIFQLTYNTTRKVNIGENLLMTFSRSTNALLIDMFPKFQFSRRWKSWKFLLKERFSTKWIKNSVN